MKKVLIGGQALRELGSSRHTNDVDYLIFDESNYNQFSKDEANNIDYMNANGSNFSEEIWKLEQNNKTASPQSLFDLKAFALLSHIRNGNLNKENDCVFDLRFLSINYGITDISVLTKYITKNEREEILKSLK